MCYTYSMVHKLTYKKEACPPDLQVIDAISGKWTVLIIYILSEQTRRHSELHRMIPGISQKMLTHTLRRLERDGIVARKIYPVVPPQVEYSLTALGESLVSLLSSLCSWAKEHYGEVQQARTDYDAQQSIVQAAA